jgi:uncharacterized iron-regulated membrane protein
MMTGRTDAGGVRRRARARWRTLHLWLGLVFGAWFVLLGLTGSALVFYREIDAWLNPQVFVARQPLPEHGPDAIFQAIERAHPERTRSWRLEIPRGANRAWTARYYFAAETRDRKFAPLQVTVDPYTLRVVESRFWGRYAMTFIYDLHYVLLLDDLGSALVAIAGLLLLASLLSGVRLWWPSLRALPHALTARLRASAKRRVYDIHKLGGVYGLLIMGTLAATGTMLAEPTWFEPMLRSLSTLHALPTPQAEAAGDMQRIGLERAATIASRMFPRATVSWLETPDQDIPVYRVRLHQPGEPSLRFPQTFVWIDAHSGRVLAIRDARDRSAADATLAWLHPLHNGEAFGTPGRWLAFAGGLLPLVLLVTGWLRWRAKAKAASR